MKDRKRLHVLIFADATTAARWSERLLAEGAKVWRDAEDVPEGVTPDVIVAGRTLQSDIWLSKFRRFLDLWFSKHERFHEFPFGVVTVGAQGEAEGEVSLPEDATPREVQLACRLLAQIVHLRHQRGQDQRRKKVLSQWAMSDSLTGLANRRAWDRELALRVGVACQGGPNVCVMLVDLDHFKQVNDRLGHPSGDHLLKAAGDSLAGSIREEDFVARLGGDEFGVLLSGVETSQAMVIVERIRSEIKSGTILSTPDAVSASAGYMVVESQENSEPADVEIVLANADRALRVAKQQGRDRSVAAGLS